MAKGDCLVGRRVGRVTGEEDPASPFPFQSFSPCALLPTPPFPCHQLLRDLVAGSVLLVWVAGSRGSLCVAFFCPKFVRHQHPLPPPSIVSRSSPPPPSLPSPLSSLTPTSSTYFCSLYLFFPYANHSLFSAFRLKKVSLQSPSPAC